MECQCCGGVAPLVVMAAHVGRWGRSWTHFQLLEWINWRVRKVKLFSLKEMEEQQIGVLYGPNLYQSKMVVVLKGSTAMRNSPVTKSLDENEAFLHTHIEILNNLFFWTNASCPYSIDNYVAQCTFLSCDYFISSVGLYFRNNPHVLGENNQNLPRILHIIAEVFQRDALSNSAEVSKRLVNIVKQIQVRILKPKCVSGYSEQL